MRDMKRRQFGTVLATATLSLGGLTGAVTGASGGTASSRASVQETEPLAVEDVTVSVGGVTSSIGLAELEYEDGTVEFEVEGWTMESTARSVTVDAVVVTVDDVSAETYSTVRAAMLESFDGRSPSPLLGALAEADVNPDAAVRVVAGPVESDGQLVFDELSTSGTVGSVVPEGSLALVQDGASLEEVAALGPSEWTELTVQRGDSQLVLDDVSIELDGQTLSITSPDAAAETPERSLVLSDLSMTVLPPESIPEPHVQFATRLRQMAADETLTLSTIRSAAAESGVTVANTSEAVQSARFDLTLGEVTENEETLVSNFETSGTLAELAAVLSEQA